MAPPDRPNVARAHVEANSPAAHTLDPTDWTELRAQGHRMLDDMFNYLETLRERPVWQPIPEAVRARFRAPLPREPSELSAVHQQFMHEIMPFAVGNAHPGFMGWVHGGGTPVGMLAEMLAAGLDANLGGRDHIPIEVERQILRWVRELFDFPDTASGLFVTGSSIANFIALVVARTAALGAGVRRDGLEGAPLTAYTSTKAHGCIVKAMELSGLGSAALRLIPVATDHTMNLDALERAIVLDRDSGRQPFFIAGTAGTVDIGACDDLAGLAEMARRHELWLHIDGAYGALGMLAPELAPRLRGIERADSIAFDFHKWTQVPYDAGFILVRDGAQHQATFASSAAYLRRDTRGLAAGSPWPCDFGPDLSRGFRALKTWFTFRVYGARRLGEMMNGTCELARYMAERIDRTPELERLAPVPLNIVCFRYRCDDADRVNAEIVVALQESGLFAPSTTHLDGRLAIRAAIVNHRTQRRDIDGLLDTTVALGNARQRPA